MIEVAIYEQHLYLHPSKAIFWKEKNALLLADLHLGKAAHFRKNGLAVPPQVLNKNLDTIGKLLQEFHPEYVFFLGDLFHSTYNQSWESFANFVREYPEISFILIKGNHDILETKNYEKAGLFVENEPLEVFPFLLSHHPLEEVPTNYYNLYGHIHPGVNLYGRGGQAIKLPCFFFGKNAGILPAFGAFTGLAVLKAKTEDKVFVILEEKVLIV